MMNLQSFGRNSPFVHVMKVVSPTLTHTHTPCGPLVVVCLLAVQAVRWGCALFVDVSMTTVHPITGAGRPACVLTTDGFIRGCRFVLSLMFCFLSRSSGNFDLFSCDKRNLKSKHPSSIRAAPEEHDKELGSQHWLATPLIPSGERCYQEGVLQQCLVTSYESSARIFSTQHSSCQWFYVRNYSETGANN